MQLSFKCLVEYHPNLQVSSQIQIFAQGVYPKSHFFQINTISNPSLYELQEEESAIILMYTYFITYSPLFAVGAFVPVVSLLSNVLIPNDAMNIKIMLKKIRVLSDRLKKNTVESTVSIIVPSASTVANDTSQPYLKHIFLCEMLMITDAIDRSKVLHVFCSACLMA